MAHVRFGPREGGCPACFILRPGLQPGEQAPCGIALGLATVAMAESPLEIGELLAQACPEHQLRITQFVVAFAEMAGVDYHSVMARLGARPSGPGSAPTLIHLAEGDRTRCGHRALADPWPEDERFVYASNAHQVTCQACQKGLGQT